MKLVLIERGSDGIIIHRINEDAIKKLFKDSVDFEVLIEDVIEGNSTLTIECISQKELDEALISEIEEE